MPSSDRGGAARALFPVLAAARRPARPSEARPAGETQRSPLRSGAWGSSPRRTLGELGARLAEFSEVSQGLRHPSWIAGARGGKPVAGGAELRAPRIPTSVGEPEYESGVVPVAEPLAVPAEPATPAISLVPPAPEVVHVVDAELSAGLVAAIAQLEQSRRDVNAAAERDLVTLATTIARRVIARELRDPSVVNGLVAEGLAALSSPERLTVRLGAAFAPALDELAHSLAERGLRAEVRIDASLPDHGCQIETELGRVDESIAARLDALLAQMGTP